MGVFKEWAELLPSPLLSLLLWSPCECHSRTSLASTSRPGAAVEALCCWLQEDAFPCWVVQMGHHRASLAEQLPCRRQDSTCVSQWAGQQSTSALRSPCALVFLAAGPLNWGFILVTPGDVPLKSQWPCDPGECGPSLLQAATLPGSPMAAAVALQQSLVVGSGSSWSWRWKGFAGLCSQSSFAAPGLCPAVVLYWHVWVVSPGCPQPAGPHGHVSSSCGSICYGPACPATMEPWQCHLPMMFPLSPLVITSPQVPHSGMEFCIFPLFLYF